MFWSNESKSYGGDGRETCCTELATSATRGVFTKETTPLKKEVTMLRSMDMFIICYGNKIYSFTFDSRLFSQTEEMRN